jgi:hypothetical protein
MAWNGVDQFHTQRRGLGCLTESLTMTDGNVTAGPIVP